MRHVLGLAGAVVMLGLPAAASAATTVTEFSTGLPPGAAPAAVAPGADGNVWFIDPGANPEAVGRITPSGAITEFTAGLQSDGGLSDIAKGPGGVWVTETAKNKIARVAASGAITEFSVSGAARKPTGIVAGPDGNLWFTAMEGGGAIGRITPTGTVTTFTSGLRSNGGLQDIALGPDGNLWFTESNAHRIGRITPQGTITEFATGLLSGGPQQIAAGPDGNLWFTETGLLPGLGRVTPQGAVTEFSTGLPLSSNPSGIAGASDGYVHFTDNGANVLGQISSSGTITTSGAGLSPLADLGTMTTGPDGRLWFADGDGALGRMSLPPTGGAVTAANVTDVGADLSAPVSPNSETTTYAFEWGTTTAYGSSTAPASAGAAGSAQTVTGSLGGLTPSTIYHVRVVATNATGTTTGPDRTFTTTPYGAPSATTLAASAVDGTSAVLNGAINPANGATTYRFEWGLDTSYGAQVPVGGGAAGSDATVHVVTEPLTGLVPNTWYHARVVASSPGGTTYGDDEAFLTDAVVPDAATGAATGVGATTATLAGTVNPRNSATAAHVEYGLDTTYGAETPDPDAYVGADVTDHPFTQAVTGLEPNRTYHFRVVAGSNAGQTAGADQTFTTAAVAPGAVTGAGSDLAGTSATVSGTVNAYNSTTTWWVEWGTSGAYDASTPAGALGGTLDAQDHAVRAQLTGLAPATTYHYRVVAWSPAGTTRGADATLTTPADLASAAAPASTDVPGSPLLPTPQTDPAPLPVLGRTVVASLGGGTVRVRRPGSEDFVQVAADAPIPVGSEIDARHGTIELTNALDAQGGTQTGIFWGGVFRADQPKDGGGRMELTLTQRPTGCGTLAAPRAVIAKASKKKRKPAAKKPVALWGRDDHGAYQTHGRTSVATVRGTKWVTVETCEGTKTRVTEGTVAVRDLHRKRTVVVRAGHTYLARARR